MLRREFIALLSSAVAYPLAAQAQRVPVIGFLNSGSPERFQHLLHAFRQGLSKAGFVEGRNVTIDYRWAHGNNMRLPEMAANLVERQVAVIVANAPAAAPAKTASATIPIVFVMGSDPVKVGLISSLNHPGGNITGVTQMGGELGPKRLELLRELVPKISNVALLLNPSGRRPKAQAKTLQAAAQRLGLPLKLFNARTDKDLDEAFATMASLPVGGLIVSADAFFNSRSERIATLALRHSIPAIYQYPEFTAAGGLASYGGNLKVAYFELGNYTARILKGEKAGDLPVRRAAHIEMIINRKTAKTLGISIPLTLQGRADELVE